MLAALGLVLTRVTGVGWAGFLFVALAAGGGMALRQNLIRHHCDSGEIGQMMYISLYLAAILPALRGGVLSKMREGCSVLLLLLAYSMKETTVVLLPAVALLLFIHALPQLRANRAFVYFSMRHMLVHVLFAGILLFFVWISRSGDYVADNYEMHVDYAASALRAWSMLDLPWDLKVMLFVGLAVFIIGSIVCLCKPKLVDREFLRIVWGVTGLLLILATGFWAVNLPWQQLSGKYFINTYIFVCALIVLFVVVPASILKRHSLRYACWLWIIGTVFFVLRHQPELHGHIENYYRRSYAYRRTARAITDDVHHIMHEHDMRSMNVLVVTRNYFTEGPLLFWRQLNREHGLNIARKGRPVAMIRAVERNYFRRYEGVGSVELRSALELSAAPSADLVYFIKEPTEEEIGFLAEAGFQENWKAQVGSPAFYVRRFSREGLRQ